MKNKTEEEGYRRKRIWRNMDLKGRRGCRREKGRGR